MMFPVIIKESLYKGVRVWHLDNGNVGTSFRVDLFDLENRSKIGRIERIYEEFFESLNSNLICRSQLFTKDCYEISDEVEFSRSECFRELGFKKRDLVFSIELNVSKISKLSMFSFNPLEVLVSGFDYKILEKEGLNPRFLTKEEITSHYLETINDHYKETYFSLDFADHVRGVVKLKDLSSGTFMSDDICYLKDLLPSPSIYSVTFQRRNIATTELSLERQRRAKRSYEDESQYESYQETAKALKENRSDGKTFFDLDIAVILKAKSTRELREMMEETVKVLRPLGKFNIETYGTYSAYKGHLIGNPFHTKKNDLQYQLSAYMPLFSRTDEKSLKKEKTGRELVLQRMDGSLYYLDPFAKKHKSYCMAVIMPMGSGKSFLSKQQVRAFYRDPSIHIIKVDVGGNSSEDVRKMGGVEYAFNIDKPTNLNPFAILKDQPHKNSFCAALSGLIYKLIKETGEFSLSKAMENEVNNCVYDYSMSRPQNPTLEDYIRFSKNHPRLNLLKRWTTGLLGNTFSKIYSPQQDNNRFKYFNLENITDAGVSGFAEAVFSTILTLTNYEFIIHHGDLNKKIVLNIDEVHEFFHSCYAEIERSVLHGRKHKMCLELIFQDIKYDKLGVVTSLCDIIVLSSKGSNKERLMELCKISEEEYESLDECFVVKGEMSVFLIRDKDGARFVMSRSTKKEAWGLSSEKHDREVIKKIMSAGFSEEEAVTALVERDKIREYEHA